MQTLPPRPAYLIWSGGFSAALHGFWVLSTVYAITEVGLTAFQLVMLGTALEITVLVSEIPTGVVSDAISRKWSVVLSMVIIATGFIITGISTTFWPILFAQMLWGLGWTFTSGADTAWVTDELFHWRELQGTVDRTIAAGARWAQYGGLVGLLVFGPLGYFLSLRVAIVVVGVFTLAVAMWVAVTWQEHGFARATQNRYSNGIRILRQGWNLARGDEIILRVLVATVPVQLRRRSRGSPYRSAANRLGRSPRRRTRGLHFCPRRSQFADWRTRSALG